MPKYFDIHSHPQDAQYDADREEMIKRLKDTRTHTIAIGTDLESSKQAVELAEKHEEIYACIGVHPVDDKKQVFEKEKFEELVKHLKVVAVGECGLDFYHAKKEDDFERQKKLFLDQVDFALAHDKPIMIHARPARLPGGGDAYLELLELLEPLKKVYGDKLRGNMHFFAGSKEIAQRFFDIGFTISFTGVITFTHDYDEVIKSAPINMIMSETDAPYVAPVPYRGKRNEPSYVREVVKRIAEIRGEDEETVRAALAENAISMIG
ncbi:MAG: TatD family hydrolase [Minisyncoccia bacterium]